jgi:hypothetical protein
LACAVRWTVFHGSAAAGWKVAGWKVAGWKVAGWKVAGWKVAGRLVAGRLDAGRLDAEAEAWGTPVAWGDGAKPESFRSGNAGFP